MGGRPTPTPDDPHGCLHGCLFNLTADRGESHNLYRDESRAADVARLLGRLDAAGQLAPPWFQVPAAELAPYVTATDRKAAARQLDDALCQAAHRAGGVAPIDV